MYGSVSQVLSPLANIAFLSSEVWLVVSLLLVSFSFEVISAFVHVAMSVVCRYFQSEDKFLSSRHFVPVVSPDSSLQ